jgi:hypothetical protein
MVAVVGRKGMALRHPAEREVFAVKMFHKGACDPGRPEVRRELYARRCARDACAVPPDRLRARSPLDIVNAWEKDGQREVGAQRSQKRPGTPMVACLFHRKCVEPACRRKIFAVKSWRGDRGGTRRLKRRPPLHNAVPGHLVAGAVDFAAA